MKMGLKIAFFYKITIFLKNYLTNVFHSFSNLGLCVAQLKYQRSIKAIKFLLPMTLDSQSEPEISNFHSRLQKCPIFKVFSEYLE